MPLHPLDGPAFLAALTGSTGPRKPFVLDLRTAARFDAGHVPGSVNVPVHDLGHRRRDLPASAVQRILLVGEPGRRTEAGARFLELMGFADLAYLEGGIDAYPGDLETGPPA